MADGQSSNLSCPKAVIAGARVPNQDVDQHRATANLPQSQLAPINAVGRIRASAGPHYNTMASHGDV
jgi:hypothetical protein